MSRLAEIYKQEKKSGGNLGGAVSKRMAEKLDPRQMIDPKGIIATLFPVLKAYSATPDRTKKDSDVSNEISGLTEISKITAKNSIVLPSMARDFHLVKQNIIKLVKLQGGTPQTRAGDFLSRQAARESAFESKMAGKFSGLMGGSKLTNTLNTKRDGQTKKSALFVTESDDFDVNALLPSLSKGAGLKTLLTGVIGAMGPLLLAGGGLALLGALFVKMYKSKGAFLDKEESDKIDAISKTGGLAGVKDEQDKIKKLPEYERTKAEIAQYEKTFNEGQKLNEAQLKGFSERGAEAAKAVEDYKRANNIGQTPSPTPAPAAPVAPTPTPTSPTPSSGNQVMSGSGSPVMTGSGVPLTSGESSPSRVSEANVPSGSDLPIDYKSYAEKIGEKESGGKYDEVNTLGYLGKYQFGAMALQDMGLVKKGTSLKGLDDPANWNIDGGKQAFLNNAQLQEDTMLKYTKQNLSTLNRIGVVTDKSSTQDIAGYLAASHLLGPGGAKKLSKGEVGKDAYGTSSTSYFKIGSATQGSGSTPVASSPSTGDTVSAASMAVADGQRASTSTAAAGDNIVINAPSTQMASSGASTASAPYDKEMLEALFGRTSFV
jgi:hypothetical protein